MTFLNDKTFSYASSVILDPIDYLSDIENLVSFERAMFEDYGFKYKIKYSYKYVKGARAQKIGLKSTYLNI